MSLPRCEGTSRRGRRPNESRGESRSLVTIPYSFVIEVKSIKQKKKLIDKMMKMRQDSEHLPAFKKV